MTAVLVNENWEIGASTYNASLPVPHICISENFWNWLEMNSNSEQYTGRVALLHHLGKWCGTGTTGSSEILQVQWSCIMKKGWDQLWRVLSAVLGVTNEGVETVLQCLDVMLTKRRKQVSQQRALAFIKRLCTLALHVLPNSSIGILATNRILMHVSRVQTDRASFLLCNNGVLFDVCLFPHLQYYFNYKSNSYLW